MKTLGFEREIVRSSLLPKASAHETNNVDRLIDICQHLGCNRFYEGQAGKNYIDDRLFGDRGITIEYQSYKHPLYQQLRCKELGFIPYLSVIDLLANEGPRSLSILLDS